MHICSFFLRNVLKFLKIFPNVLAVIVCFYCVDFEKLSEKISKRRLDGAKVTLEQIEQTDSVLVENLHPGTTPDTLNLYFESKRGGAQKVKEVTMLSEGTAKVSFVNHECKFCTVHPLKLIYLVTVFLVNKLYFL